MVKSEGTRTVRLTVTEVALPAWLAVMEQVPAETSVKVVCATVHTGSVVEVNTTVNPDVEEAVRATGAAPSN
jgi:hypothetical protein